MQQAYAVLGAELAAIVAVSTALSYRWRHGSQHASLRLVATPFAKLRPRVSQRANAFYLLAFRLGCAALWIGVMLHAQLGERAGSYTYLFFTTWNYVLQIAYWLLSAAAGIRILSKPFWAVLETRAERALARTVWALFSVCLPSSIMVTVVLWGVLLPATLRSGDPAGIASVLGFTSFMQHLVNTLLLFTDFSVNCMLVDASTLALVVYWNVAYVVFEWLAHSMGRRWTYFFLTLNGYTWLWYAALASVGVAAHALTCLASQWKLQRLCSGLPASSETSALESAVRDQEASGADADGEEDEADAYQRI